MNNKTTLNKGMYFTDIHFGKKTNSEIHNNDCTNFIKWMITIIKEEKCDYIAFLGDWFEQKNAINVGTLNYSYKALKLLNELNIPIYFIVGNHDLYKRNLRTINSVEQWSAFSNIIIVNEPLVCKNIKNTVLFVPYLFQHEYASLLEYNNIPVWAGHFEFNGFVVTGSNVRMKGSKNHKEFSKPKYILSGHFHKRQKTDNIVYIGNTFPMDFSDNDDNERGCMILDHSNKDELIFYNWEECPKYLKTTASSIKNMEVLPNTHLRCVIDEKLSYEESIQLKQTLYEQHTLRDCDLEETDLSTDLEETEVDEDILKDCDTLQESVVTMLGSLETEQIDNNKLIKIYNSL